MFLARRGGFWLLASSVLLGLPAKTLYASQSPLTADQIIQRASARGDSGQPTSKNAYTYTKVTVTEELDRGGNVKEHKEKVWQVSTKAGSTSVKLLEVNGRPPGQADLRTQNENETSVRQMLGGAKTTPADSDNFLTPELVARFDFTLAGETEIAGRHTYELRFRPKQPEPPVHHMVDRLLNRISGTIWIDASEFEIARAQIQLRSEVDFLGGVAGCLRKLAYNLTRVRVADGLWLNASSKGDFEGRKLLESMRVRTRSQLSNFRPLVKS